MPMTRSFFHHGPSRRGFFGKLVLSMLLIIVGGFVLLNHVITVTAADVAKNPAKYDNQTAYIMGTVERIAYFPEANLPSFELRTRMGKIWICSTKDLPILGSKVLMESTFYCTPEKFWTRFSEEHKHDPDAIKRYRQRKTVRNNMTYYTNKPGTPHKYEHVAYPVGYEMVRIRMPF